jgi:hypothetical protein
MPGLLLVFLEGFFWKPRRSRDKLLAMAKEFHMQKNVKKKPLKSKAEKRAEKLAKKSGRP